MVKHMLKTPHYKGQLATKDTSLIPMESILAGSHCIPSIVALIVEGFEAWEPSNAAAVRDS